MRPLPEPMDGEAARPPRSTDDTAHLPRVILPDPDEQGRYEKAWREREAAAKAPHYPRHQAAKDDLPGPTRRELARLVRQVRALVIVALVLVATLPFWVQGLYQLVY